MGLGTFKPGVFGVAPILLMGGGGLGTFNLPSPVLGLGFAPGFDTAGNAFDGAGTDDLGKVTLFLLDFFIFSMELQGSPRSRGSWNLKSNPFFKFTRFPFFHIGKTTTVL